ncbi:MAG: quinone oxidoreductase [Rhizomicrobium sp.]
MKAIRFAKTGGPDVLQIQDIELPAPAPGFIRVRHRAIGINFIDTYQRSGLYALPLPSGLGSEAAGVVEAVGEGVKRFVVGDRVGYCSGPIGAYAEANNVAENKAIKLPEGIGFDTAAASMLKGFTVQYLIKRTFAVQPGQTVLFHAAAGGVGLIAGQWLHALGVKVIGTVGSAEKRVAASEAGYDRVFLSGTDDWVKAVRNMTDGVGVPVVYDSIGKDTFERSLDCLAPRGLMVSFGNASGAVPPFSPGLLSSKGSLYLTRPSLQHYIATPEELQQTADDFFAAILSGKIIVTVGQIFRLSEAQAAHESLHSRKTIGSTILVP